MSAADHCMSEPVVRRARKTHWCDTCGRWAIKAGQQYYGRTIFPGHDVDVDRPTPFRECFNCSQRYGRDDLYTDDEWRFQ